MPSPSAACLAPSPISLALATHPWGLPDSYPWPRWERNWEILLPARHLPCPLMVWESSCPHEKRGSQTSTDLLALKLFHGKTCFFLSARGGLIPVFSSGWDQKWDRGVPSSTAQQSVQLPASFTPHVAARKVGLSRLALICCKIFFHLKK